MHAPCLETTANDSYTQQAQQTLVTGDRSRKPSHQTHIALPAWSRPNNSRPKLTEGKRRNRAKNPANHLPRPPDAGVVGILGDGLLSTWSWFTSSDALSRNVGSLLVAAAATVPVPVENADEAEFGLPLAPPPMGLIPPPELGVAALRAGVTAAALPAPKLLMLVAALRVLPAFTPGIAGGAGPLGMPISASAAASILACDQPAWAADISGVISDLSFGVCWRAGERGAVERFGLLLASLFRSIKPRRLLSSGAQTSYRSPRTSKWWRWLDGMSVTRFERTAAKWGTRRRQRRKRLLAFPLLF